VNPRRRAQSTARWIVTAAIAVAAVVAVILTVIHFSSPLVVVTEAVEGPVVQAFYSTGTVQPVREFPIKANVAGTIIEVRVDKGDAVTKGPTRRDCLRAGAGFRTAAGAGGAGREAEARRFEIVAGAPGV
jgi:multidrug efflux pump subunit AcrA (membrane-fusion protein)